MRFFERIQYAFHTYGQRDLVVKAEEDLDHYVLYAGVFRDEFEVEGKCGFHFYHEATYHGSRTEIFQQATPVLASLLMPGLIQYIIEYPNCVLERNYYGLPTDCEIPASLDKTEQKRFAEAKADIILLMDHDHDVWTILLSDHYSQDTLVGRLEDFCKLQKKELKQYLL